MLYDQFPELVAGLDDARLVRPVDRLGIDVHRPKQRRRGLGHDGERRDVLALLVGQGVRAEHLGHGGPQALKVPKTRVGVLDRSKLAALSEIAVVLLRLDHPTDAHLRHMRAVVASRLGEFRSPRAVFYRVIARDERHAHRARAPGVGRGADARPVRRSVEQQIAVGEARIVDDHGDRNGAWRTRAVHGKARKDRRALQLGQLGFLQAVQRHRIAEDHESVGRRVRVLQEARLLRVGELIRRRLRVYREAARHGHAMVRATHLGGALGQERHLLLLHARLGVAPHGRRRRHAVRFLPLRVGRAAGLAPHRWWCGLYRTLQHTSAKFTRPTGLA